MLVGRDDVLDHLLGLLAASRIVTLTGTGGAGKTRLAAELAALRTEAGPVWWADLSGVSDRAGVQAVVAGALGASTRPDDADAAIMAFLTGRAGLLVLDTCEHVVDLARSLVRDVVAAAPGLRVLATSRQPLRVEGELAWPVPPLALPDPDRLDAEAVRASGAVELFVARAAVARPGFVLDDANAADVGRICLLLDGVPLAIELAAAQLAILSPTKLLGLLDDRLRVLVDGRDGGRHHTLRAAIDWSYQLLDDEEARFLDRLSVFAGSFDVDAAVVVAGTGLERDGLDLLLSLVRQSLVSTTVDDRFRLLDTIASYGRERLTDDERAAAHVRLGTWCADFAAQADRQLRSAEAGAWLPEVRREIPNLRAGLAWAFGPAGDPLLGARVAASLAWFWGIESQFAEADRWLRAAAEVVEPGSILEADVLTGQGIHAASLGHLDVAETLSRQAADRYEHEGDRRGLARALIYLGVAQWGQGKLDDAAATHDRCASTFRDLRDEWGLGLALSLRARTGVDRGEADVALLLDAALALVRRSGDPHLVGLGLDLRAREALRAGDALLAESLAHESLTSNEAAGYLEGVVASLHALGLAVVAAGRDDEARVHHRRGLAVAIELDHPAAIAESLECLAVLAADTDAVDVVRLLAAADAVRSRASVPRPAADEQRIAPVRATAAASLDPEVVVRAETAGRLLDVRSLP